MKKIFLSALALMFIFCGDLFAGVTIRYYNKDSQSHTFNVKICGSNKTVEFGGSRTASVTIQGCSEAVIYTKCGDVTVKDGAKIEIKDGCIKVL